MSEPDDDRAILQGIVALLRSTDNLLRMLSAGEVKTHSDSILNAVVALIKRRLKNLPNKVREPVEAIIDSEFRKVSSTAPIKKSIRQIAKISEENYKQKRDAKPRNTERDKEIVHLRDECPKKVRRSFAQIARMLKDKNNTWAKKDGTPLDRKTVEIAYYRQKERDRKE